MTMGRKRTPEEHAALTARIVQLRAGEVPPLTCRVIALRVGVGVRFVENTLREAKAARPTQGEPTPNDHP